MTVLEQSSPMQATNPAGVGSHSKKDEAMQRKDKDHDRKEKHCNDGNVLEAKRSITIENNIESGVGYDRVIFSQKKKRNVQKIFAFGKISLVFLFLLLTSVVDASEVGKMEVKEDGNVIPNGDNGNIVDLDVVQSKPRILSDCKDEKGKHYFESVGQSKGCGWVNAKKETRCLIEEAKMKCPVTCGTCAEIQVNQEGGKDKSEDTVAPKSPMPSSRPSPLPSSRPTSSPVTTVPTSTLPKNGMGNDEGQGGETKDNVTAPAPAPGKSDYNSTNKGKNQSTAQGKGKGKGGKGSSSSKCENEPEWKVSGIIRDSGLEPFEGMTCEELENEVETDQYEAWCEFHKVSTKEGKSAFEACCFCGGGSHVETPCEDFSDWTMNAGSKSQLVNCPFIENVKNPESFCNRVKMHKGLAGQTAPEACCVCGGGYRPIYTTAEDEALDQCNMDEVPSAPSAPSKGKGSMDGDVRKLHDSNAYSAYQRYDYHHYNGIGESPGIPNLEYLGLGYDGLRGNPRGSFSSEIDPGFRSRVFALLQSQDKTSIDSAYTIPLGTDFKYTSSCRYDDRSVEISSEEDYSSMLSTEADMSSASSSSSSRTETYKSSNQFGFSLSFPTKIGFLNIGGNYESQKSGSSFSSNARSQAFQKSEKFSSFSSISRKESSVSFEAKAMCSEFEIQFNEYDTHTLDPRFKQAMNCLPDYYEPGNPENKAKFAKFIANYGTHYTRKVVLGAKRILTTTMSSTAVAELTRQSVDVASALSVQMQEAMAKTSSERYGASIAATLTAMPKNANPPELKFSDPEEIEDKKKKEEESTNSTLTGPMSMNITVNVNTCDKKDEDNNGDDTDEEEEEEKEEQEEKEEKDDTSPRIEGSFTRENSSSSTSSRSESFSKFARSRQQAESASKIFEKNSRTTEVNIGGLPKSNWREWAESVKAKPMPIQYELVGLWNLMNPIKAEAFFEAFKDIEDIDIIPRESKSLLDAMHFGVSNGFGEPLSSYSLDTNADYRALLRTEDIDEAQEEIHTLEILGNSYEIDKTDLGDMIACGLDWDFSRDGKKQENPYGLKALTLVLCNVNNSYDSRRLGKPLAKTAKCPIGSFINGFSIQRSTLQEKLTKETLEDFRGQKKVDGEDVTKSEWTFKLGNRKLHSMEMLFGLKMECKNLKRGDTTEVIVFEAPNLDWGLYSRVPGSGITSLSFKTKTHYVDFEHEKTTDHNNQNRRFFADVDHFVVFYKALPLTGSILGKGARTYTATWKGKKTVPTAMFATPILGNSIGRDSCEEEKLGFFDVFSQATDFLNGIPFGISNDYYSSGDLAMSSFNKNSKALHSFSFLTVEDLPTNRKLMTTGIVGDRALLLNDDIDVEVTRVGKASYSVNFIGQQSDRPVSPIILATPHWYTKSKSRYPKGIEEVSLGVVKSDWRNGFHLALGTANSDPYNVNGLSIGFNFIAIDANLDDEDIKVGYITKEQKLLKSKQSVCEGHGYSEAQCISIGRHDNCCFWNGSECKARDDNTCDTSSNSFEVEWISIEPTEEVISLELCEVLFNNCDEENIVKVKTEDASMARITFTEAFDAIPTVILTPVLSDMQHCRSFDAGFGSGNGNKGEDLSIPHCIVNTIEKHSFSVHCGCLQSSVEDGEPTLEYSNIPFNFVATGPSDKNNIVESTKWRLVANSDMSEWDMTKLQMFRHSKLLEPKYVFASNHIDGTFPCNVVDDAMHWKGNDEDGDIFIGFEFKFKEKVTKVMFQNSFDSNHPVDLKLQALINDEWVTVEAAQYLDQENYAWNNLMVIPKPLPVLTSTTLAPTSMPTPSPSTSSAPTIAYEEEDQDLTLEFTVEEASETKLWFRLVGNDGESEWIQVKKEKFGKNQDITQLIPNSSDFGTPDYIEVKTEDANLEVQGLTIEQKEEGSKKPARYVAAMADDSESLTLKMGEQVKLYFEPKEVYYSVNIGDCNNDDDTPTLKNLKVYGIKKFDDSSYEEVSLEYNIDKDGEYKESIGDIHKIEAKFNSIETVEIGGTIDKTIEINGKVKYVEVNGKRFNFDCMEVEKGKEYVKEIW